MNQFQIFIRAAAGLFLFAGVVDCNERVQAQSAVSTTVNGPRSLVGIRFRFHADGPVRGGFALADARLLFGTEAGTIYALDSRDGRPVWRRNVRSPVLSTPAIAGSAAYFTTWDNALHALDLGSGRLLWRRDLGRTMGTGDYWEYYVSSPVFAGGRLYVGSASGRLLAIDAASGKVAWSTDVGGRVRSTAALTADAVIVGTNGGHVLAVARSTGRILWRFATEGAAHDFSFKDNDTRSVMTSAIVLGDLVIAGGRDGNIYGIDLRTGRERWRETHDGGSWILGLAGDARTFYSGSGSALIVQAADSRTGKELWRTATGNAMFGGLAKAGDVLISNGNNGHLFGLDAATGAQLWRFRLPDMALSSPLVTSGAIFTGADDGSVYGLDTNEAAAPALDRYVYSYTNQPEAGFFWFKPDRIEAIRGGLASAGYAKIGTSELVKALANPVAPHGRKVILLADTRLPAEVDAAMLRHYLDGGGALVLIGPDPVVYGFDSSGAPTTIDTDKEKAAFGLHGADKAFDYGYNVSTFAPTARRFGLTGAFTSIGWQRPSQVSLVLASDRSGMATAWAKRFASGGLLINLPLPRYGSLDTARLAGAIDLLALAEATGSN